MTLTRALSVLACALVVAAGLVVAHDAELRVRHAVADSCARCASDATERENCYITRSLAVPANRGGE